MRSIVARAEAAPKAHLDSLAANEQRATFL
jgi:hypothetical protein